jgi:hypothetical protein
MAQAAVGAHRFGTFGFAGHSKNPRPPHPGQGTFASWVNAFFMLGIPRGQAPISKWPMTNSQWRGMLSWEPDTGCPLDWSLAIGHWSVSVTLACHEKLPNHRL